MGNSVFSQGKKREIGGWLDVTVVGAGGKPLTGWDVYAGFAEEGREEFSYDDDLDELAGNRFHSDEGGVARVPRIQVERWRKDVPGGRLVFYIRNLPKGYALPAPRVVPYREYLRKKRLVVRAFQKTWIEVFLPKGRNRSGISGAVRAYRLKGSDKAIEDALRVEEAISRRGSRGELLSSYAEPSHDVIWEERKGPVELGPLAPGRWRIFWGDPSPISLLEGNFGPGRTEKLYDSFKDVLRDVGFRAGPLVSVKEGGKVRVPFFGEGSLKNGTILYLVPRYWNGEVLSPWTGFVVQYELEALAVGKDLDLIGRKITSEEDMGIERPTWFNLEDGIYRLSATVLRPVFKSGRWEKGPFQVSKVLQVKGTIQPVDLNFPPVLEKGRIRVEVLEKVGPSRKRVDWKKKEIVVFFAPCPEKIGRYFYFKADWVRCFPKESGVFLAEDLYPGKYIFRANCRNRIGEVVVDLPPSGGKAVVLEIPPGREIHGLIHGRDGKGIDSMAVLLRPESCPGPFFPEGLLKPFGPVETKGGGKFVFDGVGEGEYYIIVKDKNGKEVLEKKVVIPEMGTFFNIEIPDRRGQKEG